MKSGFSLTKRYVPNWKGNDKLDAAQQLVAVLSMPNVNDLFSILDRLSAAGFTSGSDSKLSMEQATKIAKEAGQYVPVYVKLENAEDFSVSDVITFPPYFTLATELLFALVQFAQPSEDDQKN